MAAKLIVMVVSSNVEANDTITFACDLQLVGNGVGNAKLKHYNVQLSGFNSADSPNQISAALKSQAQAYAESNMGLVMSGSDTVRCVHEITG